MMLNLTQALEPVIVKADEDTEFVFVAPDKFDSLRMAEIGLTHSGGAMADVDKLQLTRANFQYLADKLTEIRNLKVDGKIEPVYGDAAKIKKFFLTMPNEFLGKCLGAYAQRMAMSENFPTN